MSLNVFSTMVLGSSGTSIKAGPISFSTRPLSQTLSEKAYSDAQTSGLSALTMQEGAALQHLQRQAEQGVVPSLEEFASVLHSVSPMVMMKAPSLELVEDAKTGLFWSRVLQLFEMKGISAQVRVMQAGIYQAHKALTSVRENLVQILEKMTPNSPQQAEVAKRIEAVALLQLQAMSNLQAGLSQDPHQGQAFRG